MKSLRGREQVNFERSLRGRDRAIVPVWLDLGYFAKIWEKLHENPCLSPANLVAFSLVKSFCTGWKLNRIDKVIALRLDLRSLSMSGLSLPCKRLTSIP